MPAFDVVSPEQWTAARNKLRAQEADEAKARAEVNTARRSMPAVAVEKVYQFDGPQGPAALPDLFEGRPQLVVYHFMFDPSWSQGCKYCSQVIDGVGHLAHMNALGTTFAAVSRAPQAKIRPFRQRMGWQLPWYTAGPEFNADFDATDDRGALTVFLRDGDTVYRTYSAYDDEVDLYLLDSSYLDLSPLGIAPGGEWPRHHDKYGS
jgi:predicted dithiol-disulfide oxidoreductase (DUF899 family)